MTTSNHIKLHFKTTLKSAGKNIFKRL